MDVIVADALFLTSKIACIHKSSFYSIACIEKDS